MGSRAVTSRRRGEGQAPSEQSRGSEEPSMLTNRGSLWWLLGPPVVYLVALPLVNRVEPVVLGLPFMMFWMLLATLVSPLFVWLAAKGDPVWAAARRAEREQAGAEAGEERG